MEHFPMRLYVSVKYFVIHWPGRTSYLVLERHTHRVYSSSTFRIFDSGMSPEEIFYTDIYFFLGVIPINTVLCIAVVTKAHEKGVLLGKTIYEISEIEIIEFNRCDDPRSLESSKTNIKKLLSSGFYFSFSYALTLNIGHESLGGTLHDESDKSFYWNFELYKEFVSQDVDTIWFVPIIQGFFNVYSRDEVTLALLSRRSCERAGTRYNCRGIDDNGNVANFVETEQILIITDKVFSYIQIRGSVPIYWGQTGVMAQMFFTKTRDMSVLAFSHHTDKLIEKYGHVTMINLLTSGKSFENSLTNEWEAVFSKVFPKYSQKISYNFFDFHMNCKGQKYHKVNSLIERISVFLQHYGHYSSDGTMQKGVVRTNCLDCLDRTNVVQSFISWDVLMTILRKTSQDHLSKKDSSFSKAFKLQWADNGDYLSFQYTGTGSTISAITRDGSIGLKGFIMQGITSINRFYNANIQDDEKQTSIDFILRRKNTTQLINKITEEMDKRSQEYSQLIDLRIRIVTWNLCGDPLSYINELISCEDFCTIVAFAFQHVEDFSSHGNIIISSMVDYTLLKEICIDDFILMIFIEDKLYQDVTSLDQDSVSLPHKGNMSKKGACAVVFELWGSTFAFIACNLVDIDGRNSVHKDPIRYIHSHCFNKTKRLKGKFDCKVLFGDLNFKANTSSCQVHSFVNEEDYDQVFKAEQLAQSIKYGCLSEYKEAEFTLPSNISGVHEKEENEDFGSSEAFWSDRILYSGNLVPEVYRDLKIQHSRHRPKEAQFVLQVKRVNQMLRKETENKVYQELRPGPLGSLPKMICAKDLI